MGEQRVVASTEPVLVTGVAGFIGFSFARTMLAAGRRIVGVDSVNDYYDPALKESRLKVLHRFDGFAFHRLDLADRAGVETLFRLKSFQTVVHLAAQAGVRYSLENPYAYLDANLAGFLNVLEGCRRSAVGHLIFASSSSVYGANTRLPFSVRQNVDHPLSLYAATKKANEVMAHAYSHLYAVPMTGLRFFTVYGPWGRPDMAISTFTRAIIEGLPIKLFNGGRMRRDFTYIDDAVAAMAALLDRPPTGDPTWSGDDPDPASSRAPWRIYNVGNGASVEVTAIVDLIERELGRKARREFAPMQPGDVPETLADVDDLVRDVGFRPATSIEEGIRRFVEWCIEHYGVRPGKSGARA